MAKAGTRKAKPAKGEIKARTIVAIVGGGCAGLTVAWHLSQRPGYEVHVYEKSWRLGGKGASGRTADGRITEHGLHIWLGFYENAFRMMRECYAEVERHGWGPQAEQSKDRLAHGSFASAFFPEPHIGVAIPGAGDDWLIWSGLLPPAKGAPGEDLDEETNPFTLANYLLRCFELLKALMYSVIGPPGVPGDGDSSGRSTLDQAIELDFAYDPVRSPTEAIELMGRYLRAGALTTAAALLQAVTIIEQWLRRMNYEPQVADTLLNLMQAVAAQARKQLADIVKIDPNLRCKTEVIDIVMTIAVGLYRDRVLFSEKGLDAINHIDYKEWLRSNGATRGAVDSQFINGIYDLVFAYRAGDRTQPALAAGVALRGALRMFFTYRGAMFWRMRSGMGDAVFAPLYKVLAARGVKFHLRHELTDVQFVLTPGKRRVKQLEFAAHASAASPLDHFGCWPDEEQSGAAPRGDRNARKSQADVLTLKDGSGFHAVVFAMGIADLTAVLSNGTDPREGTRFFEALPRWEEMCRRVETVATRSAQVWLNRDLEQLGWSRGSGIFTAFRPPFETWADMTHTLATEKAWRATQAAGKARGTDARCVAYFCSVMPDTEISAQGPKPTDAQMKRTVKEHLHNLLTGGLRGVWPAAFKGKHDASDFKIDDYAKANWEGSDRYTLSVPGSPEHRISPLDGSVQNMTIAGDWTATGLDAGCVEGAVMSGMLAAFAITNTDPPLESIVGYDHP